MKDRCEVKEGRDNPLLPFSTEFSKYVKHLLEKNLKNRTTHCILDSEGTLMMKYLITHIFKARLSPS